MTSKWYRKVVPLVVPKEPKVPKVPKVQKNTKVTPLVVAKMVQKVVSNEES